MHHQTTPTSPGHLRWWVLPLHSLLLGVDTEQHTPPSFVTVPSTDACLCASLRSVLLLNSCVLGGTSMAGFLSKKLTGFIATRMISQGMTGKSSMRGIWMESGQYLIRSLDCVRRGCLRG